MKLSGMHHLTAITSDAAANLRFYTVVLGMRLIKKTVNQDDVSAYHLFYGDGTASVGSDITFFEWDMPPERRGNQSIVRTSLRVNGEESLKWWKGHLKKTGVRHSDILCRDGRLCIDFEDLEGQRLSLVDDGEGKMGAIWEKSPVPPEYQIKGLGPIIMSVADIDSSDAMLTSFMGMRNAREYQDMDSLKARVRVYEMEDGGAGAELHVIHQPDLEPAVQGAGGVHHVAFCTSDTDYDLWAQKLKNRKIASSGKVNRYYFRSLYFREPNGVLFEIATEGPGFTVDEPVDSLGEKLALPPFLEDQREEIEAELRPIERSR